MKTPRPGGPQPPMPMPIDMLAETLTLTRQLWPRVGGTIVALSLLASAVAWLIVVPAGLPPMIQHFMLIGLSLLFEVAVYRLVLLDEDPPPLGLALGPREIRFIAYYLVLFLLSFAIMTVIGTFVASLGPAAAGHGMILLYLGMIIFVFLYLFLRLLPGLVATALDWPEPLVARMVKSWTLTRSRVATIFSASLMLMMPTWIFSLVIALMASSVVRMTGAELVGIVPGVLIFFAAQFLLAVLRAVYYRRLGGLTHGT